MNSRFTQLFVLGAAGLFMIATQAGASGLVLQFDTLNAAGEPVGASTVYLDGDMLRVNSDEGGGGAMVYDNAKKTMMILEVDEKKYTVIDEATMEELGGQMDEARKQMEEQMASMPEAQREMMMKMMKDKMPGLAEPADAPTMTLNKTNEEQTINGTKARRVDVMFDDTKQAEHWVASYEDAGVSAGDMAPMHGMAEFFTTMLSKLPVGLMSNSRGAFDGLAELDGFPIKTISFRDGEVSQVMAFKSASREDVSPDMFKVPEGFSKQSFGK